MSTTSSFELQGADVAVEPKNSVTRAARGAVAWSSFLFAMLQSLCTFFGAANGLRTVIGLGAITLTASQGAFVSEFHSAWFRRPMNGLALAGAVLNLIVLWQVRRLRARPAAQWRVQPVSAKKLRGERLQLVLAVATIVLVAVEESLHLYEHGRL